MSEDREHEDREDRGWDALETEDEERLIPIERYEKEYPPFIPPIRWRGWFKNAVWIFLACVPIAIAFALVLLLGH